VEGLEAASLLVRLPLLLARIVMELVPVAAFGIAAYALLPLLTPGRQTQVLVVSFVSAYVLIRGLSILVRMILIPAGPSLRLLSMGPETAHYLFIWSRRLIATWVVGYYASEAALLLGLPPAAHGGLIRVVGLLITAMVVVFLLQNRAAVAERIRGRPAPDVAPTAAYRLRRRLADVWHVLAIVYVVGVFLVWALNVEGGFHYLLRATVASAVIVAVAKAVSMALRRGIERGFAVGDDVAHRFPLLEARVNRYVPTIHMVLRAILHVVVVWRVAAWGLETLSWLETPSAGASQRRIFHRLVLVFALICGNGVSSIERYLTGRPMACRCNAARGPHSGLPLLRTRSWCLLSW